ncbi:YciI family protein [Shewanella sp. FJAT-52076]|uniref:YciI family protein n=1 Tax=Shewanella sp. FJAT-52076 TaxID=2864202 RepID=UPI001C662390|nr:YciI family protein [Shewanella sp. FJAT-52076]QYJ77041.1 YciI family protein [Shewanella sp. FJAT-52076]
MGLQKTRLVKSSVYLLSAAAVASALNLATPLASQAEYDEALAAKVGADEYGMKSYVMAFLKKGPNRSGTDEERARLQRAHLDNIGRLAKEGKLVLAGPFLNDGELRGIYLFDVKTVEEARALTESDPAIKAGSLVMELVPWYGSAAITQLPELHEKFAKKTI